MKATVKLDTRRKNKDGLFPVVIRISHKQGHADIPTELYALESEMDEDRDGVYFNRKRKNNKILNADLDNMLYSVREKLNSVGRIAQSLTAVQLKNRIVDIDITNESETFISYFRKFIQGRNALRTQKIYENTLNKIISRHGDCLTFDDITTIWLSEFHQSLKNAGNKVNTISIDERNIRAVIKSAIDNEVTNINDPFRRYKIKEQKDSETMPLSVDQIKAIRDFETNIPSIARARDIFMISFYLAGINISDIYDLKKGDRAKYHRNKTKSYVDMALPDELIPLIEKYKDDDRMFNFYRNVSTVHSLTALTNEYLKRIGKVIGEPNLILYHARHTWATFAANLDIEERTIAKALSHRYESITGRYARFNFQKVDDANRKVLDLITNTESSHV